METTRSFGVGELLRRGQQVHERIWFETVGPHLTSVQYGVLVTVGRRPAGSQQEIGDEMSIDKSTVGNVLHRLAERDLVELRRDGVDRRRHVVALTDGGRAQLIEASPAAMRVGDLLLQNLSFLDGESLVGLLRQVAYRGSPPAPDRPTPHFAGWPLRLPVLRFDMTFGHLVRRAQRVYGGTWRAVVGAEVTPVQYDAMVVLNRLGDVDQSVWTEQAALDPATATSLLSRLKQRDLVERKPHPADRRRKLLSLTTAGTRLIAETRGDATATERAVLTPLTAVEQGRFTDLLARVAQP